MYRAFTRRCPCIAGRHSLPLLQLCRAMRPPYRKRQRQTDTERELADSEAEMLDRKFAVLLQKKEEQPEVTITYFVPDKKKDGGSYHTSTGHIRKIDPDKDVIELTDGTSIPIVSIKNIDYDYFEY